PEETSQPSGDRRHLRVIGVVVAGTAVYLAVFTLLGYVIATSIYLLALMAYFHPGKWTSNLLTSVLFCIGSYLMFSKLLGVSLPQGVLPF
ncbi:MAG: tripartite tricarboxylate transporter TctB family protein, partial [Sulfuricaulis sp.]|nr:tripartite tricarboxylate transporter TctB family protein [Sulfuricaulis sp.]